MSTTYQENINLAAGLTVLGTTNLLGPVNIGGAGIADAGIADSAEIAASKQEHRFCLHYDQINGTDVVAATRMIHVVRAVGRVHSMLVRPTTVPAGGDKTFTVDLQKAANGSATWTTVLAAVVTISSADANNTLEVGTLVASPTLAAGDALRLVVAVTGSTGSQGQGMVVSVEVDESGI